MLQTSKSFVYKYEEGDDHKYDTSDFEFQNIFETRVESNIEDVASNQATDKNPIVNKRILLKVNSEQSNNIESDFVPLDFQENMKTIMSNDDPVQTIPEIRRNTYKLDPQNPDEIENEKILSSEDTVYDKLKQYSAIASTDDIIRREDTAPNYSNGGRIVVYGDSNCLDSTHIEKPCFWLLDALLEYTMSSHVSKILKDLNHKPNVQLSTRTISLPKRLPDNNLHLYSKVLQSGTNNDRPIGDSADDARIKLNSSLKRRVPKCSELHWDPPIFLNISRSDDLHSSNERHIHDLVKNGELNLRRKLESEKGEVRSVGTIIKLSENSTRTNKKV